MTNGFAFCVKRQAKNDFLKDVEGTVVSLRMCKYTAKARLIEIVQLHKMT